MHDENVEIQVHDDGLGIPLEDQALVLADFHHGSHERCGTGLGLAIVRSVAAAHGGTVSIHSEVGEGTVVTMHLPLRQPSTRAPGVFDLLDAAPAPQPWPAEPSTSSEHLAIPAR